MMHIQDSMEDNDATFGLKYSSVRTLLSSHCSKMEQDRILETIDLDSDGIISFEEFSTKMIASYERKDTDMLESAFNKLDANGDGYLDHNELV